MKATLLPALQFGALAPLPLDNFNKLMKPRSIALIGASEAPGAVGTKILDNLLAGGYQGTIYPVNPKYAGQERPQGEGQPPLPYVGSVSELPDQGVDMAVIMTPNRTVPGIVDQLGAKGVKAVVLISAGFQEIGPAGQALQQQLQASVERHGITLVGPNCLGVVNPAPDVMMNASFGESGIPRPGKGALVSQSGGVGIDLIDRASRMGQGVSQFVSIGNSMQVDGAKLLQYWKEDPSVSYVLGYLESIPDSAAFRQIAKETSKTKPILMIKAGRSEAGAKAAGSHTGALAGSDHAAQALFTQTGIQRMNSIQDLFAAGQAFEYTKPSVGNRVAVYSNAGGYAVMATDLLDLKKKGLQVAQLSEQTETALNGLLPAAASKQNPIDTTATAPADNLENYKQGLLTVMNDPNVDSCIVAVVPIMGIQPADVARVTAEVQQLTHKPLVAMVSTGEAGVESVRQALKTANLPPVALYTSVEEAVTSLAALEKHRVWKETVSEGPVRFSDVQTAAVRGILDQARSENRKLLTTTESLDVLKAYGIAVPETRLVQTLPQAMAEASAIGYPLVLKLNSKTISHKTDIGGVVLDLRTPLQLREAFETMMKNLRKHGVNGFEPGEGLMLQQFLPKGREVIMGINDDPQFGKMLMLGLGGIYVEIFKDVQFRLPPVTRSQVRDMLEGLQSSKILKGYRGKPGVDLDAVESVMLRLSQLAQDFPEMDELDINPYMAQPKPEGGGLGGYAVDARIILKEE
jgi:acetyltransferase